MKKIVLLMFSMVYLFSCSDTGIEVVSYADYSSDISYQVGSPRDTRLTFFDINELKQIRTIPNNLSKGALQGRVQFAQTHTIDPNNHEKRNEPSLIPYRNALLLFTPQINNILSLKVEVFYDIYGSKSESIVMKPPINMPQSDYNNISGKKDITYSKRSWSCLLPYNIVRPDMKIVFSAETKDGVKINGTLDGEDIEFASPIEGVFLFIKLGLLTDDVPNFSHDMITDPAHAMQEYFQTVPFSVLVNGQYEDKILKEVILSNGKIYKGKSDDLGEKCSGDMYDDVAVATISVGINQANKGVISSGMNSSHYINHDMFYFTSHHARGKYTDSNGNPVVVDHGMCGGNGIGTLFESKGNEFSCMVGYGYGMVDFPNIDESADGSIHGYTTSWGYDAYKNRMRANISWNLSAEAYLFQDKYYITPFQKTYNWNKDAMADALVDSSISRYTHSTARSTRQIQKNLSNRYFLSGDTYNGKYYYKGWDHSAREYKNASESNFVNTRINPTQKGVPVITILGGYDPANTKQSLIYPYFRSNWGNVFASIFQDRLEEGAANFLEITYYGEKPVQYVILHDKRHVSHIINKFHINIAERDKPRTISLYVNNTLIGTTTIEEKVYNTSMPKAITIGNSFGYDDVLDKDILILNESLRGKKIDNYNLSKNEKELIDILYRYKSLYKLDENQAKIAKDYIVNKDKIDKINMYIDDNYTLLENNDISADNTLRQLFMDYNLGKVEFKFNQAEINGRCIEVNKTAESKMSVKASECNESKNQRWAIDKAGRIHSAVYPGYCLSATNMNILQICDDNNNQRWKIRNDNVSNGVIYESIAYKESKCIDNSEAEPDKITINTCSDSVEQKFKSKISEDNNTYFGLMSGSLLEEIWKYIPAEKGE